jgi:hypothetical protein
MARYSEIKRDTAEVVGVRVVKRRNTRKAHACLASTILSGQRQLLFPNALVVDRSRRGCGKVGIPRGLRDFQVRWESPKDFSTERLFHSLFARDFLRATSSWLNNNLFN